jgi:predicted RNase H-like HicB family nuclease
MSIEYSVQVIWSEEDGAYVAFPAELPGCIADGQTQEEALTNLKVIIAEWIETANEAGRPIPKPMSVEDFARENEKASANFQKHVHKQVKLEVENAVKQIWANFMQQQSTVVGNFHKRVGFFQTEEFETAGGNRRR